MSRFNNPLASVSVATPCPAEWNNMAGGDRVRFCNQCELNVYNLSAMTRAEAEALITRTEGRLCVRFYRRNDGSIITQDCPVGLRALRRRAAGIRKAIASTALGFLAGLGANATINQIAGYLIDPIRARESTIQGTMIPSPGPPEPEVLGRLRFKKRADNRPRR
jgi:hypothetical protein